VVALTHGHVAIAQSARFLSRSSADDLMRIEALPSHTSEVSHWFGRQQTFVTFAVSGTRSPAAFTRGCELEWCCVNSAH
jgi:hypothetical protein